MVKKKIMDTEGLAVMVQHGFEEMSSKFEDINLKFEDVASKLDIKRIEDRLDRIENILLIAHDRRIEKLEDRYRLIATKLKIK